MIRTTFVMEQHIGHQSYYQNLRRYVDKVNKIQPNWVEVTYSKPDSLLNFLPVPKTLRDTLIGRQQTREGLRQQAYHVSLFNTQVPAAIAGKLARQKPYLICTDITPIQYDQMAQHYGHKPDAGGLWSKYKHHTNRLLFCSAAKVLPWSSWTAASLVNDYGVSADRVEIVAPGVDTAVWHPPADRPDRPPRVLFVGGDFYRKGGELLLNAFRTIRQETAVELVLVTRSTIPAEPGVEVYNNMQPNSPELVALYQGCDIFALPTRAEAFGIAAIEACATGLPIVATRVGGLIDIVAEGENGFLFNPDDQLALTNSLRQLVVDKPLRQQFSENSRLRAERHFDARTNADRIVSLVRQVANA